MNCPNCGADSGVLETRRAPSGLRRRRWCKCGHKFTTLELIVPEGRRFSGELRLVPANDLVRIREIVDELNLSDDTRVVSPDLDSEQVEEPSIVEG